MDRPFQPRRSLLFVPGLRTDRVAKAAAAGADIVCIDLEDAIAPAHKNAARTQTLAFLADGIDTGAAELVVRINGLRTRDGLDDVRALLDCPSPPPAIALTKVETADEVRWLDTILDGSCAHIRFHVIIETNDGLEDCYRIARACPRIDSLFFGAVDMSAELRSDLDWGSLLYARSRLVHAAAGAALDLLDVPHLDLNDATGLETAARASAALGFTGKAAIHPRQIPAIHDAFSPGPEQVAHARRVVDAFAQSDDGLVVIDGKLIEKPVLRSMRRVLAVAGHMDAAAAAR